jgi:hypothetical protein
MVYYGIIILDSGIELITFFAVEEVINYVAICIRYCMAGGKPT